MNVIEYTYSIQLEPQYRDLDPNGHVNQAVYSSYCEQTRSKYWEDVIGQRHDRAGLALVKLELEYTAEIVLGDTVTVNQRIGELGNSSLPMKYEIATDGEVAATGQSILIAFDRDNRQSRPIPDRWRRAINRFEGHENRD